MSKKKPYRAVVQLGKHSNLVSGGMC